MFQKKLSAKKILFLLLSVILLISFSGCKNVSEPFEKEGFVSFTDSLDRYVSVPEGTLDAAVLTGSFADIWTLSGGNVTATAKDAFDDFGLVLPDAVNLGKVKEPNLELLLSANPSFVIASSNTSSNVELLPILESAGITVAYFEVSAFSDYLSMLDICTDITGRKDLYKNNGLYVREHIEKTKKTFEEKEIPENEKSYLLLRASSGFVKAKGSDEYVLGGILMDLGYQNIADSDKSLLENLSIESIIKQNPHHIFIVQMGDDLDSAKKNVETMFSENPAWMSLSAVKDGRVHFMDKRLFSLKPNAKWGESYEILANLLRE